MIFNQVDECRLCILVLSYLPQWVHMYIHMHMGTHMHTNTHTGILNEYVCPAERQRRKMNSSVVLQTVLLSLPVKQNEVAQRSKRELQK